MHSPCDLSPAARHVQGIDEWKTPFPRHKGERKGEPNLIDRSKNTTPIGPNSFALLGTDGNEVLGGVSSGKARGGSKPSITASARTSLVRHSHSARDLPCLRPHF